MIKQITPGITKLRLKSNMQQVNTVVSVVRSGYNVTVTLDNGETLTESQVFAFYLRGE